VVPWFVEGLLSIPGVDEWICGIGGMVIDRENNSTLEKPKACMAWSHSCEISSIWSIRTTISTLG
jgi:hypothetical protein